MRPYNIHELLTRCPLPALRWRMWGLVLLLWQVNEVGTNRDEEARANDDKLTTNSPTANKFLSPSSWKKNKVYTHTHAVQLLRKVTWRQQTLTSPKLATLSSADPRHQSAIPLLRAATPSPSPTVATWSYNQKEWLPPPRSPTPLSTPRPSFCSIMGAIRENLAQLNQISLSLTGFLHGTKARDLLKWGSAKE